MPDPWEYPWFAAWDLAFHAVAWAHLDPAFAKYQLLVLLREWYLHPNGALPAYEWSFDDVNPPVHAFAALRVFAIAGDDDLPSSSASSRSCCSTTCGGSTGRTPTATTSSAAASSGSTTSAPSTGRTSHPERRSCRPTARRGWPSTASPCWRWPQQLAEHDAVYDDLVVTFLERFMSITRAINSSGLYDPERGFFYDFVDSPAGRERVQVETIGGAVPLFSAVTLRATDDDERRHALRRRLAATPRAGGVRRRRARGARAPADGRHRGRAAGERRDARAAAHDAGRAVRRGVVPLAVRLAGAVQALRGPAVRRHRRRRELHGRLRAGRVDHADVRRQLQLAGAGLVAGQLPRHPVARPLPRPGSVPTSRSSTRRVRATSATCSRSPRTSPTAWSSIFLRGPDGHRPVFGGTTRFQQDPAWDNLLFFEYFHGDNGAGLGASHQTGWTALVIDLLLDPPLESAALRAGQAAGDRPWLSPRVPVGSPCCGRSTPARTVRRFGPDATLDALDDAVLDRLVPARRRLALPARRLADRRGGTRGLAPPARHPPVVRGRAARPHRRRHLRLVLRRHRLPGARATSAGTTALARLRAPARRPGHRPDAGLRAEPHRTRPPVGGPSIPSATSRAPTPTSPQRPGTGSRVATPSGGAHPRLRARPVLRRLARHAAARLLVARGPSGDDRRARSPRPGKATACAATWPCCCCPTCSSAPGAARSSRSGPMRCGPCGPRTPGSRSWPRSTGTASTTCSSRASTPPTTSGLYDRLVGDLGAVRGHLCADADYQARSARFLENHDEPRAATVFGVGDRHRAAAVITYLVPGAALPRRTASARRGGSTSPSTCAVRPTSPSATGCSTGSTTACSACSTIPSCTTATGGCSTSTRPGRATTAARTSSPCPGAVGGEPSVPRHRQHLHHRVPGLHRAPRSTSRGGTGPRGPAGSGAVRTRRCRARARGLYIDLPPWAHNVFEVSEAV